MENWKVIRGYEGRYEVSDRGRVRSLKTGKFKKPTINKRDKACYLQLWKNSRKPKCCKVHRLVLTAFRGKCPRGEGRMS